MYKYHVSYWLDAALTGQVYRYYILYILLLWIKTQWLNQKWKINPSNSIYLHIYLLPWQFSRTFHLFLLLIFSAILVHFLFFFLDCVLMTYSHFHELTVMWSPKKKLVKNVLLYYFCELTGHFVGYCSLLIFFFFFTLMWPLHFSMFTSPSHVGRLALISGTVKRTRKKYSFSHPSASYLPPPPSVALPLMLCSTASLRGMKKVVDVLCHLDTEGESAEKMICR